MLTRTVCIIILAITFAPLYAKESTKDKHETKCSALKDGHQCHLVKSGNIKLKINSEELDRKKIALKTHQDKIAGDLHLYHSHIYDDHTYKDVIQGEFLLDNHTEHNAHVQYQLLLKDKIGLIAKTVGSIHLPKGAKQPIRCSNIPLSAKEIKNINSYEIRLVTSKL
ncbi:MAG: hypothetical protein JSR17_05145 [Proteobacteria bacterium]|nr:hypothetical protein [Pseudomonadota bacterium]